MKISLSHTEKLSKNELYDILNIFCQYSNIIKSFLGFSQMRVGQNLNFAKKALKKHFQKMLPKVRRI